MRDSENMWKGRNSKRGHVLLGCSLALSLILFGCASEGERGGAEAEPRALDLTWRVGRATDDLVARAGLAPAEWEDCPVDQGGPSFVWRSKAGGEDQKFWVSPETPHRVRVRPAALRLSRLALRPVDSDSADASPDPRMASVTGEQWIAARARFMDSEHAALVAYREQHRRCTLLLSRDDQIEWADPNGSEWTEWVPLGLYREGSEAFERLLASVLAEHVDEVETDSGRSDARVEWVPWPDAELAILATRDSEKGALRRFACEAAFRAEFEALYPGATETLGAAISGVDCEGDP